MKIGIALLSCILLIALISRQSFFEQLKEITTLEHVCSDLKQNAILVLEVPREAHTKIQLLYMMSHPMANELPDKIRERYRFLQEIEPHIPLYGLMKADRVSRFWSGRNNTSVHYYNDEPYLYTVWDANRFAFHKASKEDFCGSATAEMIVMDRATNESLYMNEEDRNRLRDRIENRDFMDTIAFLIFEPSMWLDAVAAGVIWIDHLLQRICGRFI